MNSTKQPIDYTNLCGRISLLIIYFWFGILKVLGASPAEPLVHHLCEITIRSFISDDVFIPIFGAFECLIGILFLFKKYTKIACYILWVHIFMTVAPLLILQNDTWHDLFTPTLIGQYIIKNLSLVAVSLFLFKENKYLKQKNPCLLTKRGVLKFNEI